jgi:hypothetical protein
MWWGILLFFPIGSSAQSVSITELHDREIAVLYRMELLKTPHTSQLKKCLASRGQEFPKNFSGLWDKQIFTSKEFGDLKACEISDCAFRFRADERSEIQKAKSDQQIKDLVYRFYEDRLKGRVEPYAHEAHLRIQESSASFEFCASPSLDQLLTERSPNPAQTVFEVVQYDTRMRPTARMSRILSFNTAQGAACWSKALLFSNHYEVDRVEVWRLQKNELRLSVRQRIDFLHSWWRRLRKGELREPLHQWAGDEIKAVAQCLQKR